MVIKNVEVEERVERAEGESLDYANCEDEGEAQGVGLQVALPVKKWSGGSERMALLQRP